MLTKTETPVQPQKSPKNPNRWQNHSPVDPMDKNASVGSTSNKEKSCPSRAEFFQPVLFGNLVDWRPKTSPKLTKICRHNHKDLVNLPTKGIDNSLHGLRGINEKPSKNGVFSKHETLKNFDPKELVNPRGFALGKRSMNHVKKLGETTTISCPQGVKHGNENP